MKPKVEILDTFQAGGIELASVRALYGTPFIGGDTYPVRTKYATIPASELGNYRVVELDQWGEEPCTCNPFYEPCIYCMGKDRR